MIDNSKLYRDFMHVSHILRHGHGDPALKVAPGQQRVLSTLAEAGEKGRLSQRDLGAQMGLSPAALSELLSKLEERELIERERSEADRRVTLVSLSSKGRKRAKALIDAENRVASNVFGQLTADDRKQLARILGTMLGNWEEAQ